ncbi:MAG: DUF1800 domain-containing protein [Cyclobacteriaceae bacterium]
MTYQNLNIIDKENWLPKNYQEIVDKFRKQPSAKLNLEVSTQGARVVVRSAGLNRIGDQMTKSQKIHLLKRTLFGIKKRDLKAIDDLNLDEALALLFTQSELTPPINDYDDSEEGINDPDVAFGETWVNAKHGGDYEGPRTVSLKTWMIRNMVNQSTSLEQKMLLFWHNLLPVKMWDVFYGKLGYAYIEMIRSFAFGNFKALIKSLTLDNAMLLFLNGAFNNKEAPDENYARELQELFCIGKGPNSQYTEEDVRAAARVLTGWTLDWDNIMAEENHNSVFYPSLHDTSDKTFSAFYGNKVIEGRTGAAGTEELDELIDMIFDNDETALYICRRLYQFFVYSEIGEQTEQNVIIPLATIFRNNNYEIKPVLEVLLSSEHFYDESNIGSTIKSPTDFLIGLWRTLEVQGVEDSDLTLNYRQYQSFLWNMANFGMEIGDPPSVAGWPAYYQAPSYDKYWVTTDTIAARAITSDSLLYWGMWVTNELTVAADLVHFLEQLEHPEDPNKMIQESAELFLGIDLEQKVLDSIKTILLSGQQTDDYWTTAWMQLQQNPSDESYRMVVESRLKATFQHLLQLGEAQLM